MNQKNKILIAYYSRTGLNAAAANALRQELNCDIEQVIDTVDLSGKSMFWCATSAVFKRITRLKPSEKDPGDYDLVIIGTPVWAGTLPPAPRTYIINNKAKFRNVAFLSVSGNGAGNIKVLLQFESLAQKKAALSLLLTEKEVKEGAFREKLHAFAADILAQYPA